jgi:hypothetical protein
LRSILGVVEAVALLNKKTYFHRDIKPNNIFLGDDGRWILGDLGIVLDPNDTAHTAPGHQLFSRDWIPDWCVDAPENYDAVAEVHTLAKTILYMVSGRKPRASQIDAIDLPKLYPSAQGMKDLQDFLRAEIKPRKDETASKTADQFKERVQQLIDRISRPWVPTLLFSYLNAAGQPIANVDNIRILIGNRTRQLVTAFKFRADNGKGQGKFTYRFGNPGNLTSSPPIDLVDPPPQGDWVVHHALHLPADAEPGWYSLSLDVSDLGGVKLIGAMIYG